MISFVMAREHGREWVHKCGIPEAKILRWQRTQARDADRRPGGTPDDRVIYYSLLGDLKEIILADGNWDLFAAALGEKERAQPLLELLSRYRNPSAAPRVSTTAGCRCA